MSEDVTNWLEGLGLGKYAGAFAENDIDFRSLPKLTEQDLKELGVSLGHRRVLQDAISTLEKQSCATAPAAESEDRPSARAQPREAERRQLTVMFCDLAGSTELSQQLDPEDLREVNRAYQDACKAAIERYEGFVARYMGDGVLAYFGYPQAHEDDAERAIHAGLGVVESVADLSLTVGDKHEVELGVRVGIATGPVVVGDLIGEGASQESAVVGETPNLAARLQALAARNTVVIGPGTHELAAGQFESDDLGDQVLKGIAEPVHAWRIIAPVTAESRFEAAHRVGLTPLVGREHEIGLLLERWEQAKEGDGQVVLLSGEPGLGKSRLVQALRVRIADEPHILLRYQCSPYHANSAFYPFVEQLQRAAGLTREDTNESKLEKLEALLSQSSNIVKEIAPLFALLLSIPSDTRYAPLNLSPQRQKEKTIEVLMDQLSGLSQTAPVLIVFEDVHWADPTTLEVLNALIEAVSAKSLALITHRPEFHPPWQARGHVTVHSLARLGKRQAKAMVERVTGGKPLPQEVLTEIIAKSDGVPLFLEELTKTVLEAEFLTDAGTSYVLEGPLPPLAVPSTLQDSLMARLDRLSPVKEVAQIGAAIGRQFPFGLISAVSALAEAELGDALEQLVTAQLLFRTGTPPEASYSFKHALVQEAAYESMLKSKRQRLHDSIARAIEERFPETVDTQPELIAHHCTEAGLSDKAVGYWLKAGQVATQSSANLEAVAHLHKGLEIVATMPETDERAHRELDLQLALGAPLMAIHGVSSQETTEAFFRAEELCEQLGDPPQRLRVTFALALVSMLRAQWPKARALQEQLVQRAESEQDDVTRMNVHRSFGMTLYSMGEPVTADAHLKQAVSLFDASRHSALAGALGQDPGVGNLSCRSWILWALGYSDQAIDAIEQAIERAEQLAHPHTHAYALHYASVVHVLRGEHERAKERAETSMEISKEYGFPIWLNMGRIVKGEALAELHDVEGGIQEIRQGMTDNHAAGTAFGLPSHLCSLSRALHLGKHFEDAIGAVNDGIAEVARSSESRSEADLHRIKGEVYVDLSRDHDGEPCLHKAIDVARAQRAKSLELRATTSLAQLWNAQGKTQAAFELLAPVYGSFTEGFDTADLKEAKALLEELS